MFSLESFFEEYETETSSLVIQGRRFQFHVPKSIDRFIDPQDPFHAFPLWSKIWEASVILADYLAQMPPQREKRFLEIGCGLGVAGIVASAFGHRLTMTESNRDALIFVRANALTNLPSPLTRPEIAPLDWNRPYIEGIFDYIVASEIIYSERDYQPIMGLFKTYLKPDGEIILAEGVRRTSFAFFAQAKTHFKVRAQKRTLRSRGDEVGVILAQMKFSHAP